MASNEQTRPGISDLARDTESGEIGVVMGFLGGRVQLRPVSGGKEWDAMPESVEPPSPREELSARNALRNANRRSGL